MTNSYKKTPIVSVASCSSNKKFKEFEHRKERKKIKMILVIQNVLGKLEEVQELLPHPKQYGNEWDSPRDGKLYFGDWKNNHIGDYRHYGRADLKKDFTDHMLYLKGIRK